MNETAIEAAGVTSIQPDPFDGTVQNMPEFWKAFNCAEGQTMVRDAASTARYGRGSPFA
ncbi:MAG: hypothetical protein M3P29_00480 [Acidobacteriota bacterium]|nr:hypothetical protein [Acidobacteriota bacterium]